MFAIQKPSEDGKYKAAGLEGFMSSKPLGIPWLRWEMGEDSTCHLVKFITVYGLRDKTGNYGTDEIAEMRVECLGSGPNDRSVVECEPYEAMMGPKNKWCTKLRREFRRIMVEAGWDGNGATSERYATEISKYVFSLARKDLKIGSNVCGEFEVKVYVPESSSGGQREDMPF